MAQHSHEHTHEVTNPNGRPVHDLITHSHDHDDGINRHHHYTEEPAEVKGGQITPGLWQCAVNEASGVPYVYVRRDSGMHDVIAQVVKLSDSGGDDRALANAKLMTFSPALRRFVQRLAAMTGDGGVSFASVASDAQAILEGLEHLEVRNDAD